MTPQQLNAAIKRYWDIVSNPDRSQEAFLTALEEVKAARAQYESVSAAVYSLGAFAVRSGELIVVDAYSLANHAVPTTAAKGAWVAFVGVEAGIHVALFAYHEVMAPTQLQTAYDLILQREWLRVGKVSIDTATCAFADRDAYKPLEVEKTGHQIAGVNTHLCFSNSANADGGYPVFTTAQEGVVKGVYVQFADVAGNQSANLLSGRA